MKITFGLSRMWFGITILLTIIGMIGTVVFTFLYVFGVDAVLAIGIVLIIASWLYFKYIFHHCTFTVPADRAWIISDPFVSESSAYQSTFSGYREIRAQKEFQAGFHWKYPWEKPSVEIDMSRQGTLQQRPDEVYTLKNDKLVIIRWRLFWGPLAGSLVNFIKTNPSEIEKRLRDRVEKFLQGVVGKVDETGYGREQLNLFKMRFEEEFGPPTQIDDEERNLGIWTGSPEVIDIDAPRTAQDITGILDAASKAVVASGGKMTFEEARGIILASKVNGSNVDVLEIAKGRTFIK